MAILKNIAAGLIGLAIFFLACEFLLSFTDIDIRLMKDILYYMAGDTEVHKVSEDPERLFELRPKASFLYHRSVNPKEKKYTDRFVSVNSLGFRGEERSKIKKEGVFRIVILGGSNTYGASVRDEDTYPALLQRLFDEEYPGNVEVWNAGISSYRMSQKVAYAEYIIKEFDPDLLVFQHHNTGRRAFLWNTGIKDIKALFEKNSELYKENLPCLFDEEAKMLKDYHYSLVSHSRAYRIFCAGAYRAIRAYRRNDKLCTFRWPFHNYADALNNMSFEKFVKKHKDMKIVVFAPLGTGGLNLKHCKDIPVFILDNKDKPEEYSHLHPPSYVYEWYARELYAFLILRY